MATKQAKKLKVKDKIYIIEFKKNYKETTKNLRK